VTIRKFLLRAHALEELVRLGTLSESAAQFLDAAVQAGVNILVSGPTGAGKTTLLNALGASIASVDERVVTVEEVAELQLERQLPDCVALQGRASNVEGAGEVRIRDLVRNALRMRPTRIVVGEVRGAEALDMLLAMNTGHEGSLTTIHGNTPRDALDRLGTLAMMAEERLSGEALTRMVARTIELVLQLRFEPLTGRRRVSSIFEVTGLEGDVIAGHELWSLDTARDRLTWTGIQPRSIEKMRARAIPYALPPTTPEEADSMVARNRSGQAWA
jgi:pilus assembly protein CpaF